MNKLHISSVDFFFMSYDEPNAEKHWADLSDKVPWAKRVHGIKGFDSAHRACAEQSETDWFVTVDADNIIDLSFLDETIDINPLTDKRKSFCWNGVNMINGLIYGNGGLKLWSKEFAIQMANHEYAEGNESVDFCWEKDYRSVNKQFSEVWNNASPYQAFRVGFREGVKLSLQHGKRIKPHEMKHLHKINLRNLRIWSSVGADVENGLYAMYGTRLGLSRMFDEDFNFAIINEFDWFDEYFKEVYIEDEDELLIEIKRLGDLIEKETKIIVPCLDKQASNFFRETFKERNE